VLYLRYNGTPQRGCIFHRSIYLHSLGLGLIDSLGIAEHDVFLPVVPMFPCAGLGHPFATVMLGTTIVFPGPHLQPRDLAELIQGRESDHDRRVPTLWLGLLALLDKERYDLSSLRGLIVGGAAAPQSMIEGFEKKHGLKVIHAWGMTETSPLGTVSRLKVIRSCGPMSALRVACQNRESRCRASRFAPWMNPAGKSVGWKGLCELQVRGPWVISSYYHDDRSAESFMDGWFRTGDVVTIDDEGFVQIVDRTKDLVKSGGEWISARNWKM